MTELIFTRGDALAAIQQASEKGIDWLYNTYPKSGGQRRKSSTGFLMHGGEAYPVKPLGRLANEIAGAPMQDNPITNVFRDYFKRLHFQLIEDTAHEAEEADERQRRLANVWSRPKQAAFRRAVFELYGARCLVTGCETLATLEAAHISEVASGGCDEGWNGIQLRADLHRLFDANLLSLEPETWIFLVSDEVGGEYRQYHRRSVASLMKRVTDEERVASALDKRKNAGALR